MVFKIQAFLCFVIFYEKFKMATIFGGTIFFLKIGSAHQRYSMGQTFTEIPLSSTVFEIRAFLKKI